MEKIIAEVGMVSVTGSVVLGWAPILLGIPAAIYYVLRIHNEYIKKKQAR